MQRPNLFLMGILLSLASTTAYAEIESIAMRWRAPATCKQGCVAGLERQFKKMQGAAEVHVDANGGAASIRWKPHAKFYFSDFNMAMRMIGVSLNDMQITARGTITHAGRKITLTSLGDDTNFILVSPIEVKPNQTATPNNFDAYRLQPDTYKKLLEAEAEYRIVKVTGTMLLPYYAPPNYLIVQSLEILQQKSGTQQPSSMQSSPFTPPGEAPPLNAPSPKDTLSQPPAKYPLPVY